MDHGVRGSGAGVAIAGFDLKQVVLLNGTFGPQEIDLIVQSVAADFSQYRVLRDAVAELASREDQSPASMVRLGACQYVLGRYNRSLETLKQGDGGALAHFYMAKSLAALQRYDEAADAYQAARQAGYRADDCAVPRRGPPFRRSPGRGPGRAGRPVRGRRADRRIPLSTRRHRGRAGRKSPGSDGPLRAGRRGRPQPRRGPVRAGLGERSPRQRRHGLGPLQAVVRPLSAPPRLPAEPRPDVRGPRTVRAGRRVLPADPRCFPGPSAGQALSPRRPGVGRHVL